MMKRTVLESDLQVLYGEKPRSTDWIIVFSRHPKYSKLIAKQRPLDKTDHKMRALGFDSYTFNDLAVLNKAG